MSVVNALTAGNRFRLKSNCSAFLRIALLKILKLARAQRLKQSSLDLGTVGDEITPESALCCA